MVWGKFIDLRELWDTQQSKKSFFSLTSTPLSHYFAFSIFLHKFANVNHVWNLIGWCRVRPLWLSANAEARRGWGTAAHEERFDCVEHIYDEGVYLTLCSRRLKTSQTFIIVRNEATVDVHWCVITSRWCTLLYYFVRQEDISMGINPALDYLSMPSSVEIKAGAATANWRLIW